MSNYTFNKKYITKSAEFIIEVIKTKLNEDGFFVGTGHGKKFAIKRFSSTAICYTGMEKKQGKSEDIAVADLKTAIEEMKKFREFNTDTDLMKERIPNSLLRKRTALFGILTSAEILVEV